MIIFAIADTPLVSLMSLRIYKRYRVISYPKCNEHFIYYKPKLKAYIIPNPSLLPKLARELGVELEVFDIDIPLEHISIALTYSCNLNCPYCFTKNLFKLEPPSLDSSLVSKLLNEAKNLGLLSVTITGGEPLLYKDLFKLLDNIASLDLIVRAIESNGVLLTAEVARKLLEYQDIISFIAISLDGPLSVHEVTRGYGTFSRVRVVESIR
jgi:sulfatase maturation enzyme AslB (radical SAM superfamily)